MRINSYRELDVYQNAFEAAMEIFELTKRFPVEERFSLTVQIRRSSRSICANLAEAWGKRRYPASFASKVCDAYAEASETQVWLDLALKSGYLPLNSYTSLVKRYDGIGAQLYRMMSNPDLWCKPSTLTEE